MTHLWFPHQMECCGWTHPSNWSDNLVIKNSSQYLYSCSCRNSSLPGSDIRLVGLCEHLSPDVPIFETVPAKMFLFMSGSECDQDEGLLLLLLHTLRAVQHASSQATIASCQSSNRLDLHLWSRWYHD